MDEEELAQDIRDYAKRQIAEETDGLHKDRRYVDSLLEKSAHIRMEKENQMPRNWRNCLDYIQASEHLVLLTDTEITWELGKVIEQTLEDKIKHLQEASAIEQPEEAMSREEIEEHIEKTQRKLDSVKKMVRD